MCFWHDFLQFTWFKWLELGKNRRTQLWIQIKYLESISLDKIKKIHFTYKCNENNNSNNKIGYNIWCKYNWNGSRINMILIFNSFFFFHFFTHIITKNFCTLVWVSCNVPSNIFTDTFVTLTHPLSFCYNNDLYQLPWNIRYGSSRLRHLNIISDAKFGSN